MTSKRFSTPFALVAMSAALALTGCGDKGGAASGDAVAKTAAPAGQSWSQKVVATDDGMMMGNPDAPIKLVEFASFTCSHCAEFSEKGVPELVRDFVNTGQVSYELRPFIRDPLDLTIATVTFCAGPERFFPLAENAFASQPALFEAAQANPNAAQNLGALPEKDRFPTLARAWKLDQFFASRGIAASELNSCLSDPAKINKRTEVTERSGRQYEISGTPTFLINGEVVPDAAAWEPLRDALRAAGAR